MWDTYSSEILREETNLWNSREGMNDILARNLIFPLSRHVSRMTEKESVH